jgi:tRNA 2-selenouridine synthase
MSQQLFQGSATVAQRGEFDEIIDVRSPAEFAEDHIPGAINCPVLNDAERARVGTLYKQESPFIARKIGAALVARNIADHLERILLDRPRDWRPLVYCWRGGQRSGAFTHVLRQIGWDAQRLEGGYKAWRRQVLADLAELPQRFRYYVVCGPTGSAKSRVLEALAGLGAQVLHLEDLAAHKGSVLGSLPDRPQPSQKAFETAIHAALGSFDPDRPVFVEAESRRIGQVQLPDALLQSIRRSRCLRIDVSLPTRVDFLLHDYDYAVSDAGWLRERLDRLHGLQSNEALAHWRQLIDAGAWRELVTELLERHYDPHYRHSQGQNYLGQGEPDLLFASTELSSEGIRQLANEMLLSTRDGATSAETSGRNCG